MGNSIIIDVRTPKEYAKAHIAGTLPDKEQHIMVYCKSGIRSKDAVQKLVTLGYTNVENIGSIDDWAGELE